MSGGPLVNNFEVPSWAGKPAPGLHLDVTKDTKLVQKLMIDEKKCYFFGRNKQMCDFCIDHASCSRVHAALVWHRHLSRPFLIDLGSTHGTYIGHIRLESKKPQQIPIDSEIHFGASTRIYIIRERPQISQADDGDQAGDKDGNLLGLPENENELDDNKDASNPLKRKHKNVNITFCEDDEIINPEDVDPSIGKFRNLVSTHVIATKRAKIDTGLPQGTMTDNITKRLQSFSYTQTLYDHAPGSGLTAASSFSMASKLGVPLPNLAPNVDEDIVVPQINPTPSVTIGPEDVSKEPKKKKYAKEAWPGKKPTHSLLV
ncbi:PP1R8-like protein [Mya arenaria]|uniref:PP1R8-like protein n=1 Tax=Mya arenaria TaxID=6604 RepID=A0ABY7FVV0_MYAAR|nr:PP1R8-like protein [Mya arenaria]